MNKKLMAYLASGILLLGAAAGLGTYQARTAHAATTAVQAPAPAAAVTQIDTRQQQQRDLQNPSYTTSLRTANPQNAGEEKGQDNEAAESSSLQSLAKITPAQARASALQAVPGKVIKVSLDNENGNVVYSVEVQTAKGLVDVKVDAGNGKVLAQDSEQNQNDGPDSEQDDGPDNDNIQLEQ